MTIPRLNPQMTTDQINIFEALGLTPVSTGAQQCIDCGTVSGGDAHLSEDVDPTPHRCGLCAMRERRARQDTARRLAIAIALGQDGVA